MRRIALTQGEWYFDEASQLGPSGGFGSVFKGEGPEGEPVAVKKLHLRAADAAHRELEIAEELAMGLVSERPLERSPRPRQVFKGLGAGLEGSPHTPASASTPHTVMGFYIGALVGDTRKQRVLLLWP